MKQENIDIYEEVVDEILLEKYKDKNMSGIFKLAKENIYSAIIYGVLSVALYIISKGTVFGLDLKAIIDIGILAILTSFVKNFLTTSEGKFAGLVDTVGLK